VKKQNEFYIKGFLSSDEQVSIILKAQKMGYEASFDEMGAGTFVTFNKEN